MTSDAIIGLVVTGLVGFTIGYLMLNKKPPIFRMYLAMLGLAIGYLYATGAIEDIGAKFGRHTPSPAAAVPATAPTPAQAPAAAQPAKP